MALVRLSVVIVPAVYRGYTAVDSLEKTAFWSSGVVQTNPYLAMASAAAGNIQTLPFWRDLDATVAPNISTDNPADIAVPNKIGTGVMNSRTAFLNQGYADADLVQELIGENPMQRIRDRFGRYWQKQLQRRLISATKGLLNSNIANNSSDMVKSLAGVQNAGMITRDGLVDALYTMGDQVGALDTMVVHSAVMSQMVKAQDVEYVVLPSEGGDTVPFYMGKRIIIDDAMPATTTSPTTGGVLFTSVLFGSAAFGFGESKPSVPVEIEREAAQGNGAGVETLWERVNWLLHPFGFNFTSASVASISATLAELEMAANWTRVVDRKNVPMAFLQSTLINRTVA